MPIQSILVPRKLYKTPQEAANKVRTMGYLTPKIDITDRYYRFRQHAPKKNKKYRTITFKHGIKAIYEYME